jgi:hypothetical protein
MNQYHKLNDSPLLAKRRHVIPLKWRAVNRDALERPDGWSGKLSDESLLQLPRVHLVKNATLSSCPRGLRLSGIVKVSLLLFVFLHLFAQGSTQKKDGSEPSAGSYRLRFDDQLGLSLDLQLCGAFDNRPLRFYSESRWKPVSGSRLR